MPEGNDSVRRFIGSLGGTATREEDRLCRVPGVDMAHMGVRYGDQFQALANADERLAVTERDQRRMERMAAGDARGFWELCARTATTSSGAGPRRSTRS